MLTFATKTLSTGANGQKADGTSPFVHRGAVLKKLSCADSHSCDSHGATGTDRDAGMRPVTIIVTGPPAGLS